VAELDAKSCQVDETRVGVNAEKCTRVGMNAKKRTAEEDQLNHKFAAKAREVESQAKAEVAEAERMMEVEKGRLEAELDQKKHDLEAGAAAQESARW
jgi:hypothetical protein